MKKAIVILLCLLISKNAYSQEDEFTIGLFPGSIGASFYKDTAYFDFDLNFTYWSLEHEDIGLGITWIPVNYKRMLKENYWSFINFKGHFNALFFTDFDNSSLGPFVSINYAPNFKFNDYILGYGIKYTLSGAFYRHRLYALNLECGYRMTNDIKNAFYVNVGIDLVWLIVIPAAMIAERFGK
jgi:hypothetical protein